MDGSVTMPEAAPGAGPVDRGRLVQPFVHVVQRGEEDDRAPAAVLPDQFQDHQRLEGGRVAEDVDEVVAAAAAPEAVEQAVTAEYLLEQGDDDHP